MAERLLGMYVHMHWGYKHPYSARTWSLNDWDQYLSGLRALGYNLVQIWQMFDTMPIPLTESDRKHLEKIRKVITFAHKIGMTVYIGASANTIGNEKAGDYRFENRPYFECERKLNPNNPDEMEELINARRRLIEPLAEADGFWIIDSDPGGYVGSTPKDFAMIFQEHRNLLNEFRPNIKLIYWMWDGWRDPAPHNPGWSKNPQDCWRTALKEIAQINPEPWGVLACWKGHFAVTDELGLTERVLYFPYATLEDEPSFPWTYYDPERIEKCFIEISNYKYPIGVMGNAQSHCLQLPHTYLFRHFADGGNKSKIEIRKFADGIASGCGNLFAKAWETFACDDIPQLKVVQSGLSAISGNIRIRKNVFSGLCHNDVNRLIQDIKTQISLKVSILQLKETINKGENTFAHFEEMLYPLKIWADRHGFSDKYYGEFKNLLHPVLKELSLKEEYEPGIKEILENFENMPQHGAFTKLLGSLENIKEKL